ncbi:MAG TPA: hypothetical protein VFE78_13630 [Gemmataceae bacterium]|nr:hypothetical protein [Gemmataceae bacterium]
MSIVQTPGAPPAPPAAPPRHALGLPAGSVRAILAFAVLAMLWVIALRPLIKGQALAEFQLPVEFVYLQIVMVLILAHFFAAHGGSIGPHAGTPSPLGLPRGSVRFLLLAGYLGLAVYLCRTQPKYEVPGQRAFFLLLLLLFSGFFLGHLLTAAVRGASRGTLPFWFQDVQAWVALVAMGALAVMMIVELFINPSLSLENKVDMPTLEAVLAGLVGFYFGARS